MLNRQLIKERTNTKHIMIFIKVILMKFQINTSPSLETDDRCLRIALLISFDNDKPRRAAILKPLSILAEWNKHNQGLQ